MQILTPVTVPTPIHPAQRSLTILEAEIQTLQKQLRQAEAERVFIQTAFDTLPLATAVLAPDGTILQANTTWFCFHQAQERPFEHGSIGENYLGLCEAPTVVQGIRAVISGQEPEFRLDCPWPDRQ